MAPSQGLLGKGKRVLEEEQDGRRTKQRYDNNTNLSDSFSKRNILIGASVNLLELKGFKFHHIFKTMGWFNMITMNCAIYPRLIRMFYFNLKLETYPDFSISSTINGVQITLDRQTLGRILGIPSQGSQVYVYSSWPIVDDFDALETLKLVCGDENIWIRFNPGVNDLRLIARLLHCMITDIFLPREQHRDVVNHMDVFLLDRIMRGKPVDLCYLILRHMVECTQESYSLPYGQLLTKIFEHFEIPCFVEKEKMRLNDSQIYNLSTVRSMGYKLNARGKWVKLDCNYGTRVRRGSYSKEEEEGKEEVLSCPCEEGRNEELPTPGQGCTESTDDIKEEITEQQAVPMHFSEGTHDDETNEEIAASGNDSMGTNDDERTEGAADPRLGSGEEINEGQATSRQDSMGTNEEERNEGQGAPWQGSMAIIKEEINEQAVPRQDSVGTYEEERNVEQTFLMQFFMGANEGQEAPRQDSMGTNEKEINKGLAAPRLGNEEEINEGQVAPGQDFMGINEEEENEGQATPKEISMGANEDVRNEEQVAPRQDSMGTNKEERNEAQTAPWQVSLGTIEERNEGQSAPRQDSMGTTEEERNEGHAAPRHGSGEEINEGKVAPRQDSMGTTEEQRIDGQTTPRPGNGEERNEGQMAPRQDFMGTNEEERIVGQTAPRLGNGEERNEGQKAPGEVSMDTYGEALQMMNARIDSLASSVNALRVQQAKAIETILIQQEDGIETIQIQQAEAIEAIKIQQTEAIEAINRLNCQFSSIMDFLIKRFPPPPGD